MKQAERFLRHLNAKLKNLAESPYLGRKRDELMPGLRSFPVGNYVIFYLPKRDATGRLLFNMLGAIAQFETETRAERQLDGIVKAKERGIAFGRQRKLSPQQITELQQQRKTGVLIKTLMAEYRLSKASVYRYLKE